MLLPLQLLNLLEDTGFVQPNVPGVLELSDRPAWVIRPSDARTGGVELSDRPAWVIRLSDEE